jgi:hypothetical protein
MAFFSILGVVVLQQFIATSEFSGAPSVTEMIVYTTSSHFYPWMAGHDLWLVIKKQLLPNCYRCCFIFSAVMVKRFHS